jgi:hypothetical protein
LKEHNEQRAIIQELIMLDLNKDLKAARDLSARIELQQLTPWIEKLSEKQVNLANNAAFHKRNRNIAAALCIVSLAFLFASLIVLPPSNIHLIMFLSSYALALLSGCIALPISESLHKRSLENKESIECSKNSLFGFFKSEERTATEDLLTDEPMPLNTTQTHTQ